MVGRGCAEPTGWGWSPRLLTSAPTRKLRWGETQGYGTDGGAAPAFSLFVESTGMLASD